MWSLLTRGQYGGALVIKWQRVPSRICEGSPETHASSPKRRSPLRAIDRRSEEKPYPNDANCPLNGCRPHATSLYGPKCRPLRFRHIMTAE